MKICNNCGTQVDDQANFCAACGSSNLSAPSVEQPVYQQPYQQSYQQPEVQPQSSYNSAYQPQAASIEPDNGNIPLGIVGAALFSLLGGLVYFLIYQAGVIAGISGLIIFLLANFGYRLFAKTKDKASIAALICSIVAMVVVIFAAEYICISNEIYNTYKDVYGITFMDAVNATPEFLGEPDVRNAVISDLAFAYIFGFLVSISNIINIVKARKQQKSMMQ